MKHKYRGASIILSFGENGGLYLHRGFATRLCIGRFAITIIPEDIDATLHRLIDRFLKCENKK